MDLILLFAGQHPLVTTLLIWAALVSLLGWFARRGFKLTMKPAWWLGLALLSLIGFGAIVLWYAGTAAYFDPAEPTITAVASIFGAGHPLYPALDAPERYVHVYGPALFAVHAGALVLFGPSVASSKAVGALAILTSLALGYLVFSRRAGFRPALAASAICAVIYLGFGNATFWTRAEPLLILCVSLALVSARSARRTPATILLGVAAGAAFLLKVTGPAYLVPVFILFARRHRFGALAAAGALATVVATVPFLLPSVSVLHYLQYLQLSASNGLMMLRARQNIEWLVFLTLPVMAVWLNADAEARQQASFFLAGLALTMVTVAVVGAKPGGGPFHFLPAVPVLTYAVLDAPEVWPRRTAMRSLAIAFVMTAVLVTVRSQIVFMSAMGRRPMAAALADLRRFADTHPASRMSVGYAGTSYLSQARVEMVFRSRDYWLDAPAIQEYNLSGLPLPRSTLSALADCREQYWLLPSGEEPFVVPNAYAPIGPAHVFSDEFRQTFLDHYERRGPAGVFDVWECRAQLARR